MEQEKEILQARSIYYNFFSRVFIYQDSLEVYLEIIRILKIFEENPLDDASQQATIRLLEKLDPGSNVKLIEEYNNIFYNPEIKNIRTTASFYDEGFESGKKRLEMQKFLGRTNIRRDEDNFPENEDSFPFIVVVLGELNDLIIDGKKEFVNTQHCIFNEILNGFVDPFSRNVYEHENADIFKDIIIILKSFIAFERLYLNVSKPKEKIFQTKEESKNPEEISDVERKRRERNRSLRMKDNPRADDSCPVETHYDTEDNVD